MLHYKCYGVLGEAPTVIMLHGLLGSLDNWNSQAEKLSAYCTVVTVDLRNHGGSPHVIGMSYREMMEDIVALLAHLSIQNCYVLGHSMGGKVAMMLALSYPNLVNKLLIVDIAPKAYKPRHQKILQGMMSLPLTEIKTRKDADRWFSDWVSTPVERGFLLKNLKRNQEGFYWQCYLAEIAKNYLKISGFPSVKGKSYDKETLFVAGGQSDYIQEKDKPLIKHYFPAATIDVMQHSGHLPHTDDADGFYRLMEYFFL